MEATSSTPSSPGNADSTFTSVKKELNSNPASPIEACSPGSNGIRGKEQHYVAADSNSSSTTKSFVPCKVCGDKASGYHYGVTSCEGCKGFFRRSIQKQIEYRCLRDGKCLVIRLNRNRCQYCRFKKCLSVGMSRDSVRYGRVPKRSRERSTEESSRVSTTDPDQGSPAGDSETKPLAVYDVILTISQAHHTNCNYVEELTRTLTRKPMLHPPITPEDSDAASSTAEALEQERCWLWQQYAISVTPSVQRAVEFIKRLPGFSELGQDDQLILIKAGFFEVWLCHVARTTTNSTMMLDDGVTMTRQQLEVMYDTDFAASILHFVNTFNALALNDTEIGLFSAVIFYTADRSTLTDVKMIEQYQDKFIEALKVQVGRNHASDHQLYASLLIKLPELRNLGAKHMSHLEWFRMNWTKLSLPPLFAEIFDIPKTEEDV